MQPGRGALRGRDVELAELKLLLDGAVNGNPFAAWIRGEAGIGKSRLVSELVASARTLPITIVEMSAFELDTERPFGPLVDALGLHPDADDAVRAAIGARLRGRSAGARTRGHAIVEEIIDLLQRDATNRPILLVAEDLHWADSLTLVTLARAVRARAHGGISVVGTTRPWPSSAELDALLGEAERAGAAIIDLASLDQAAIDHIAADLLGAKPGPRLAANLGVAAGNPLFVGELVSAYQEDGILMLDSDLAEIPGDQLPPSLSQTILRRIAFLPESTIETLRVASVLGTSIAIDELALVSGRSVVASHEALRPALDAGLVVDDGDVMRFRHDLIRHAAYADLPATVRRALHLEIASGLIDVDAPPARVAWHLEHGTEGVDAMTSDWLWRASETLNAIDPPTRLAFAERSLARTPSDHPRHNDRRFWCAIRALTVRFGPESERVAMELLAGSCLTEAQELALETRLAVGYASQQRRADVDRIAFASRRPRLMAMELAVMVVNVRLGEGDLAGAEAAFDAVLALASDDHPFGAQFTELWLRGGDYEASYLEVTASLAQTILRVLLGASGGALASARQVYQEWQGIALQPSASHAILALAFADAAASEWHDVYARVSRGTWHASSEIDCVAGIAAMLEGSWDDAAAHIATALAREEDSGASLYRSVTAGIGALLAVHRGDVEGFAAWDTRAAESGPGLGSSLTLAARGLDAEAHDNINEARRLLEEAWAWDGALQLGIWQRRYAADLVRVALACGAPTLARSVVDRVEELASLGDTDVARAAAGRCRGLLDNDPVVLLEVAATFDVAGWPIEAAWAREDAAVALARLARPAEAREQLGVAVAAFEQVGAYGDLRRALRRLRVHNVRRPTRPAAPRPTFGWGSLTEAERRVVDLASTGLTYREIGEQLFISRRTVETHVAHVFTKLGVRNKAQLALAFSQLHDEP